MAFLNIINQVKDNTSKIISEKGYDNVDFVVEYSKGGFGDITCNVAFLLAKNLKKNPQEIAQEFAAEYNLGSDLEKVEAHKSGYLNFFRFSVELETAMLFLITLNSGTSVSLSPSAIVSFISTCNIFSASKNPEPLSIPLEFM